MHCTPSNHLQPPGMLCQSHVKPSSSQTPAATVILQQHSLLCDQPDTRLSPFSCSRDKLDTSAIYRLLKAKGQQNDPASSFIWKNAMPPRVQMFFWLLLKGRIQCRSNLFRKHIVDSPACLICDADQETPDHLIFQCPIAAQFWS
jgi:hypothetical protein